MTKNQKIMAIVLVAVIVGTIIFVFYKRSQKSKIEEASDEKKEIDDHKHQNNGVSNEEIQYKVVKKEMHDKPKQEKVKSPPPPKEKEEVKQGTTKVKDKK
tara:strand:+ start:363 stop:662 length:300 start_codon:yes stop_codon:yes gene_type:complete